MGRVRMEIDEKRLKAVIDAERYKRARTGARSIRRRVRSNIVQAGRVDTGEMIRSIKAEQAGNGRWKVYTRLPYAKYQEHGIGPVTPKRAKALRFKPKGSGVFVFAQRTRGFPGAHFFRDAFRSASLRDFNSSND